VKVEISYSEDRKTKYLGIDTGCYENGEYGYYVAGQPNK